MPQPLAVNVIGYSLTYQGDRTFAIKESSGIRKFSVNHNVISLQHAGGVMNITSRDSQRRGESPE
jgi:hypothetical protein